MYGLDDFDLDMQAALEEPVEEAPTQREGIAKHHLITGETMGGGGALWPADDMASRGCAGANDCLNADDFDLGDLSAMWEDIMM